MHFSFDFTEFIWYHHSKSNAVDAMHRHEVETMRIPYATEMKIVRRRMEATVKEVIEEFGISHRTLYSIMDRNADLVEQIKAQLRKEAVHGTNEHASTQDAQH